MQSYAKSVNTDFINRWKADERDLREQRALELGPADPKLLRLVADDLEDEGIVELPGVDAARLRLLAAKLDADEDEIESLRQHSDSLHRALCDAIEDMGDEETDEIEFVFVLDTTPFLPANVLTPDAYSALAVFLLDETE